MLKPAEAASVRELNSRAQQVEVKFRPATVRAPELGRADSNGGCKQLPCIAYRDLFSWSWGEEASLGFIHLHEGCYFCHDERHCLSGTAATNIRHAHPLTLVKFGQPNDNRGAHKKANITGHFLTQWNLRGDICPSPTNSVSKILTICAANYATVD